MVLNVLDDLAVRGAEPTHGGKRFAERTHADMHGMFQAKVFTSTPTILAQHADGMRVVHHQYRMMCLAEFSNLRQVGNASLHAEHAIDHDHLPRIGTQVL